MASLRASRSLMAMPRHAVPKASMISGMRYASSAPADPKARAASLLDALPGNSVVSKTGWVTLGTAVTTAAISNELFVMNEEVVVLGAFVVFAGFIGSIIQEPYRAWAQSHIDKIKGILNASRAEHTNAVRERVDSVGQMKDVVDVTKQLYSFSKETAQLEHEAFLLRQKQAVSAEIKSVLDSWVRYEAQVRESEQQDLVKSVLEKIQRDLKDPKMQKDILAQAVADVENLVKNKQI